MESKVEKTAADRKRRKWIALPICIILMLCLAAYLCTTPWIGERDISVDAFIEQYSAKLEEMGATIEPAMGWRFVFGTGHFGKVYEIQTQTHRVHLYFLSRWPLNASAANWISLEETAGLHTELATLAELVFQVSAPNYCTDDAYAKTMERMRGVFRGEKNGFFRRYPRFPDGDDVMMFYVKSERLKTGNLHNEFSLMMSEAAR